MKAKPSMSKLNKEEQGRGDPYQEFANAVVVLAVKDYAHAIRSGNKGKQALLEKFFRSDRFALFTKCDPEFIIEQVHARLKRRVK